MASSSSWSQDTSSVFPPKVYILLLWSVSTFWILSKNLHSTQVREKNLLSEYIFHLELIPIFMKPDSPPYYLHIK